MSKGKAIVIGAGIHGIAAAFSLADEGMEVTVLERNGDLLQGTSRATQGRAHAGYHYPRSLETARECQEGLEHFKFYYYECLFYPEEVYYAVAKEGSKITPEDFAAFCDSLKIQYQPKWPSPRFLHRENIAESFLCEEPVICLQPLKERLLRQLEQKKVVLHFGEAITGVEQVNGQPLLLTPVGKYVADLIINATYTEANNILKLLGVEAGYPEYTFHTTEVLRVKVPGKIPAITVMDGAFVSILPDADYGLKIHRIYHAEHSIIHKTKGLFYSHPSILLSNANLIMEGFAKFFPFAGRVKYLNSCFGSRPIPWEAVGDSRQTRIFSFPSFQGLYSIHEGKFISAFTTASWMIETIKRDGLL